MWAQRLFLKKCKKIVKFYQIKYLWFTCTFFIEIANIDWSQHPRMSFQHNKNMVTSHFDIVFKTL